MAVRSTVLVLLATLVVAVSSAGFLESLLSWDLPNPEARSSSSSTKCLCQTSGCLCCVDLNLTTTIDLEGPVCVNIKQKDQNVSLNMNYEDNPVHNATIKLVDAANKPTCMNLLSDLAQICAKFTSMKKADSGYDGCMVIQPALLGTAQATYHVGCFNFDQSVRQVESSNIVETTSTESGSSTDEDDDGLNADELIAAVSASAEQGLALFSQWLGLNFNPKVNATKEDQTHPNQQAQQPAQQQPEPQQPQQQQQRSLTIDASSSRSARTMREEGSDERLKQLLSAQDNVVKGSAIIGQPSGVQTTFIYAKPADPPSEQRKLGVDKPSGPQQLTLVPRESRRGGRAYNIHQHVNEI